MNVSFTLLTLVLWGEKHSERLLNGAGIREKGLGHVVVH